MSEIVSVFIVEAEEQRFQNLGLRVLEVQLNPQGRRSPWHAGNLSALQERLGSRFDAVSLMLLTRVNDYPTSQPFVPLTDGDDQPAHIFFEGHLRDDLEHVLTSGLAASAAGRLYFLAESTYSFFDKRQPGKAQDPLRRYSDFPVVAAMTLGEFLSAHDGHALRERTIYVVEGE